MSIITSGLGGTHLITQGYGYPAIIIPIIQQGGVIRPHVIHVERTYKFPVKKLNVMVFLEGEIELNKLSVLKLSKITKLCKQLNVVLPDELSALLNELIVVNELKNEVDTEKLSVIKSVEYDKSFDELKLIIQSDKAFILSRLDLIREIHTAIPYDAMTDAKKKAKYLELLELLDKLDE